MQRRIMRKSLLLLSTTGKVSVVELEQNVLPQPASDHLHLLILLFKLLKTVTARNNCRF